MGISRIAGLSSVEAHRVRCVITIVDLLDSHVPYVGCLVDTAQDTALEVDSNFCISTASPEP